MKKEKRANTYPHVAYTSLICQIWNQPDRLLFLLIDDLGINLSGRNILMPKQFTYCI